ncbi:hypothetical protein HIM_06630 [Hirsutella minnesotensis 3608]|uniref:Swiss Army Knife protein DSP-PTPase phosphatase domain-containing protein n=1 Tax=Hirsutella minnesotensis 3608 TaxID=1043627 RepID=A0A0F7ZZC1_9HYPO|nr:hypothetical protein HIM_06630 [Hirsutella minnesotensis 3608]
MRLGTSLITLLGVIALSSASPPNRKPRAWADQLQHITPFRSTDNSAHSLPRRDRIEVDRASGLQHLERVEEYLQPGDRLFRSSAPHYSRVDSSQRLTTSSIDELKRLKIKLVISLSSEAKNSEFVRKLRGAGIEYLPLPVKDFDTPSMSDLEKGYKAFKKFRSGTLVWCGYGHGRTGTMISALQIGTQADMPSPQILTSGDYRENHVETPKQEALLEKYQSKSRGSRRRPRSCGHKRAKRDDSCSPRKSLGNDDSVQAPRLERHDKVSKTTSNVEGPRKDFI